MDSCPMRDQFVAIKITDAGDREVGLIRRRHADHSPAAGFAIR